jgi:hypothetical protein
VLIRRSSKSSKSANSPIFTDFDHGVPSTYANQNRRAPIFCPVGFGASLESGAWRLGLTLRSTLDPDFVVGSKTE